MGYFTGHLPAGVAAMDEFILDVAREEGVATSRVFHSYHVTWMISDRERYPSHFPKKHAKQLCSETWSRSALSCGSEQQCNPSQRHRTQRAITRPRSVTSSSRNHVPVDHWHPCPAWGTRLAGVRYCVALGVRRWSRVVSPFRGSLRRRLFHRSEDCLNTLKGLLAWRGSLDGTPQASVLNTATNTEGQGGPVRSASRCMRRILEEPCSTSGRRGMPLVSAWLSTGAREKVSGEKRCLEPF